MSVPTPKIIASKLAYLLSASGAELLRRVMEDPREDLSLAGTPWLREAGSAARTALLEQRALRLKATRKHIRAPEMLFTPLGLQQMTAEPLARYKAGRLPSGIRSLADLCCGMGGDSLNLPAGIALIGVDSHREALRAYRHNVGLFRTSLAIQADATRFFAKVDGILLDPARRAFSAERRDFDADPEPGWEAILSLVRKFKNAVVKLGPGVRLPEALAEEEREYLGWRDECLELSVRTGIFGRPGTVRAVELPSGAKLEGNAADINDSFERTEAPGTYLYEPVKCVIRSHLFGILAQREGLWQLDSRIAYLSGGVRVESPLLKRYRILSVLACDESTLRREVSRREIGILEIKKRGMDVDPENWRRRLKPKGPNAATLVFTRLRGKNAVLWAERDENQVAEGLFRINPFREPGIKIQ